MQSNAFIAIACNPGTEVIMLMNGSYNREELLAQSNRKQKGQSYQVFEVDNQFGQRIYNWLVDMGVEKRNAALGVKNIGKALTDMLRKLKQ